MTSEEASPACVLISCSSTAVICRRTGGVPDGAFMAVGGPWLLGEFIGRFKDGLVKMRATISKLASS